MPPDVGEVSEGFDVMAAAALEDRIDDRGAAPGRGMLDEQPLIGNWILPGIGPGGV